MDLLNATRIYYRNFFSFDMLFRVIKPNTFRNREFGFTIIKNDNKIFRRNLSFKDPQHLRKFIVNENVVGVYVGAVYSVEISPSNPIDKSYWVGRELIFDLDLTDYDEIRTCGKGKDHYCEDCWQYIRKAALFIDETLRDDFGFEDIIWVYSGRRGLHAWVRDDEAFYLDEEVRESVADYINLGYKGDFVTPKLKARAVRIYSHIEKDKISAKLLQHKQIINKLWQDVKKELPRIDKNVTMDIVRLLRMPGSVHDSSGKIVTIIDNIEKFYPDESPSVFEIIGKRRDILTVKREDKT